MALRWNAAKHVGMVFDVDGVIHRHGVPIPGVDTALAALRERNIPYVFMTNSGSRSEATKAEQISRLVGHTITAEQVVLAHTPYRHFVEKYAGKRVLLLGSSDCAQAASNYGFTNFITSHDLMLEWPELVPFKKFVLPEEILIAEASVARHRAVEETGEEGKSAIRRQLREAINFAAVFAFDLFSADMLNDVQLAVDALVDMDLPVEERVQRCDMYFQCDDTFWAAADAAPPRFGETIFKVSVASMFRLATNGAHRLKFTQCGKPRRINFNEARDLLRQEAKRVGIEELDEYIMVGDNPLVDVAGANHADGDWTSVLVRTGVSTLPQCTDSFFDQEHDLEGRELSANMATYKIPTVTSDSMPHFIREFLGTTA